MIVRKRDLTDVIRLFENVNNVKLPKNSLLVESKETRMRAASVLKSKGVENPEEVIARFVQMDQTKNEILLPVMAYFYGEQFGDMFMKLNRLISRNLVRPPYLTQNGVGFEDEIFEDFLRFQEAIDGEFESKIGDENLTKAPKIDFAKTNDKPIFEKNGISIYDANDRDKCIIYTKGGLTEKSYSFCIGDYIISRNMWQSYRDTQTSTFYFIVDNNRDFESDPLHMVVVDNTDNGFKLTDANNHTGEIEEYGKDVNGYFNYLESKGIDAESILKHKPKSPQEIEDQRVVGKQNTNLDYFKKLSYEYKYKYIGRGHELSNPQFDLLWNNRKGKGYEELLLKYLSTGIPLNEYQFNKIAEEGD